MWTDWVFRLGGDLRFHINRKTFSEEAVRFWIAEVACAIKYLHSRGIVHRFPPPHNNKKKGKKESNKYRDVKPDNILLDAEGHAHLADFNVATYIHPNKKLTGRSGTAAYMAPELYSGIGYQTSPDWFSLGVTFYECIYSRLPFETEKGDSLSRQIRYTDPPFPHTSPPVSTICVLAMSNLLDRDHHTRIGAHSWESFVEHPFFQALNFSSLESKRIPPVFQPSQDKSNFDAVYELEELLLEQAPLEGRVRKAAKRPHVQQVHTEGESKIRRELPPRRKGRTEEEREEEIMDMISEYFEPYDYTRYPPLQFPLVVLDVHWCADCV
jgi:serine/threonine kinase 32